MRLHAYIDPEGRERPRRLARPVRECRGELCKFFDQRRGMCRQPLTRDGKKKPERICVYTPRAGNLGEIF